MDQKQLAQTLDGVVESVVNHVGVDVNTAPPALLTYVAGIGPKLAGKIVEHRDDCGRFTSRRFYVTSPVWAPKAFEQAAASCAQCDGDNLLDASAIHPESYTVAKKVLAAVRRHHGRRWTLSRRCSRQAPAD
ncbi:MAG: helix-hairpin-helix domain-containing protein [Caldilineaceae bacterium]